MPGAGFKPVTPVDFKNLTEGQTVVVHREDGLEMDGQVAMLNKNGTVWIDCGTGSDTGDSFTVDPKDLSKIWITLRDPD